MALNVVLLIVGAGLLLGGGDILIRGAAALARTLGVPPMIVGLTVVAYGTSAPELVVSIMATLDGKPAICGGNIVGSNILNILLVLGATALLCPIQATAAFVRREIPIMVGVSIAFLAFILDGDLSRIEAGLLLAALVGYTVMAVRIARREKAEVARQYEEEQSRPSKRSLLLNGVFIVVGLGLLTGGSKVFLIGAVEIAKSFMSDATIGLTLVAFGTSFPELVACLVAAYRKHPDICLGNIIGSSIYNLLAIGGIAGLVAPLPFDQEMVYVHVPVMAGAAILSWPLVATGVKVSRRDGIVLLVCYAAYMAWTVHAQT